MDGHQLDLNPLLTRYDGGGKQPCHPTMLLTLLFFGYATGLFSSRKLEQATYDWVAAEGGPRACREVLR